jgi:hypothetical protein
MQNKERHRLAREKEAAFLLAFYRIDSPTRLDRRASGIAAGYPPSRAVWSANRVLDKYSDAPLRECAETVGITKARLAVMLAEFMESSEGKEKLSSIRLMMANLGEQTDSASSQKPVSVTMPVMIIRGATPERLAALRSGGAPQIVEDHAPELPPASEVIDVEAAEDYNDKTDALEKSPEEVCRWESKRCAGEGCAPVEAR